MDRTNKKYDKKIIGILSNSQYKYKYSHFAQLMKSYIEENLGIIYICDDFREAEFIQDHFKNILEEQYEEIMDRGQIKILSHKEYTYKSKLTSHNFKEFIVKQIKILKGNGFEKIGIHINVDEHINIISKDDLYIIFELLEELSERYITKVVLRFYMDEITNFEFFSLMSECGYFVVEDITGDDFLLSNYPKIITSSNIFLDSVIKEGSWQYANKSKEHNDKLSNGIIDEVSHDLKNIFATISGYAQLAMVKSKSKEVNEYLKVILNNSLDIHTIFEKFHKNSPDYNMNKIVYSLNTLVINASQMAFNMNTSKLNSSRENIKISYSLNSQKNIYCDKHKIKQVIMNIVDNGIHALNGNGNIIINTYDDMDNAILEIIDNGSGIDETTQKQIFQPYFTTKKESGMGLGLDIAKRTLERHGSTISVDSRVGVGTKFTIIFPTADEQLMVDNG